MRSRAILHSFAIKGQHRRALVDWWGSVFPLVFGVLMPPVRHQHQHQHPPAVQAALRETEDVLDAMWAARLQAQTMGTLFDIPEDPLWPDLFARLERTWAAAGYGPGHPLPPDLAAHRTHQGHTVVDLMLDLAAVTVNWDWMGDRLDWALATGWSMWTPGIEGHSGILRLLSVLTDVPELCEKLDRHGVNWDIRIGATTPSLVIEQSAVILPALAGDSLLLQAVMKAQGSLTHLLWPRIEFLVPRTNDPWAPFPPQDQTLLDLASPDLLPRLVRLRDEEVAWGREHAALQRSPAPTSSRSRHRV